MFVLAGIASIKFAAQVKFGMVRNKRFDPTSDSKHIYTPSFPLNIASVEALRLSPSFLLSPDLSDEKYIELADKWDERFKEKRSLFRQINANRSERKFSAILALAEKEGINQLSTTELNSAFDHGWAILGWSDLEKDLCLVNRYV